MPENFHSSGQIRAAHGGRAARSGPAEKGATGPRPVAKRGAGQGDGGENGPPAEARERGEGWWGTVQEEGRVGGAEVGPPPVGPAAEKRAGAISEARSRSARS